jgi:hypothetical protein
VVLDPAVGGAGATGGVTGRVFPFGVAVPVGVRLSAGDRSFPIRTNERRRTMRGARAIPVGFLAALTVLVVGAPEAQAGWRLRRQRLWPGHASHAVSTTTVSGTTNGRASTEVFALLSLLKGNGRAWDAAFFTDVTSISVAEGFFYEEWRHEGSGVGEVELTADVTVEGEVDLVNADCAGAALGSTEFTSSLTSRIVAELHSSAGETGTGLLGNISFYTGPHGSGVGVNLVVGLGEGRYPDVDFDATGVDACPQSDFWRKHRTRGYVKVWADRGLDLWAEATAWEQGAVLSNLLLLSWPTCPTH